MSSFKLERLDNEVEDFISHVFDDQCLLKSIGLTGIVARLSEYMYPPPTLEEIGRILVSLPDVSISERSDYGESTPETVLSNFRVENNWIDCEINGPDSNDTASIHEFLEIAVRMAIAQYVLSFPRGIDPIAKLRS